MKLNVDVDSPKVTIPPPLVLAGLILISLPVQCYYPMPLLPGVVRWIWGVSLFVVGMGLVFTSARIFRKNKTHVEPWKTTSCIVETGPYQYTRNPIYVAGMVLMLAVAFLVNSVWIVIAEIPFFFFLHFWVVPKEEKYLEAKFGEVYKKYKAKVTRWV